MTQLLEKAFTEPKKLSNDLQDEIAHPLLEDIQNELEWQKALVNPDIDINVLQEMPKPALVRR